MFDQRVRLNGAAYTMDDGVTGGVVDRSDEPFAYLPEQTYSWVIQYDWDTDFALITPRVSGYYKDEVYIGQEPEAFEYVDGAATLDSYTVWNARLAFQSHQLEGLEIAVFANNFTDEFYYGTGNLQAGPGITLWSFTTTGNRGR